MALALGGVSVAPVSMDEAVRPFLGRRPDASWRAEIGAAVAGQAAPEDDPRIPAQYRKDLVETLTARALAVATERAQGKSSDE